MTRFSNNGNADRKGLLRGPFTIRQDLSEAIASATPGLQRLGRQAIACLLLAAVLVQYIYAKAIP